MKKTATKPTATKPTGKANTAKPAPTKPPVQPVAPTTSVPPTFTPVSPTHDATKPVANANATATDKNATDSTTPATPAPKSPKPKAATNTKPKRMSALDAAAHVLKNAGKPMNAQELITAMKEQQLWQSPSGQTPHATLHAAISTDIKKKGNASRFRKAHRGHFTLA